MNKNAVTISILSGCAIFLFVLFFAAIMYNKTVKKLRSSKKDGCDDWLLGDFSKKLYSACFGGQDPDMIAMKLGIEVEKYYKACAILRKEPDMLHLVMNHIYGIFFAGIGLALGFTISYLFLMPCLVAAAILCFLDQKVMDAKVDDMRSQISGELPRFLDLLQTELQVGLPVEKAIYILCSRMKETLLAKEFMRALHEMQMGAGGWQEAMENIAQKYDVETLSEFVLNVTTAYRKGTSVAETVTRKADEIHKTHLLTVKERAGKVQNYIIVVMMIFYLVPTILFLLIPTLTQISGGLM